MKQKAKVYHLAEYLLIIGLILTTNSVYYCSVNKTIKFILFAGIFALMMLMAVYVLHTLYQQKRNVMPYLLFFILYMAYMGGFLLANKAQGTVLDIHFVVMLIFPILFVLLMANETLDENSFLVKVHNVIVVLAGISLFFWILALFNVPTTMDLMVNWGTMRFVPGYLGLQFLPQGTVHFLGMDFIRNTGLFVEAPMYAYVLSIGLLINLFVLPKMNKVALVILAVAMLSTASTTALIILILAVAARFLMKRHLNGLVRLISIVAIVVGLLLVFDVILQAKKTNMMGSYSMRIDDIISGYQAWQLHPFFGNGFDMNVIENYMNIGRIFNRSVGYSSGLFLLLSTGGVYLLALYLMPIIISLFRKEYKLGLFSLFNFILLIGVIVPFTFLYMVMLMYPIALWVWKGQNQDILRVDQY